MKKFIGIISALLLIFSANVALGKKPVPPPPEPTNLKNVVTVSAENGDFTSPVDAINSIIDASETNPYLIQIGPGIYDLGANQIVMKEWVSIQGSGQEATKITGTVSTDNDDATSAVVVGSNNIALTDLTIENTGGGGNSFAIYNNTASPRIERVTANALGGSANYSVFNDSSSSAIMTHVTANASGGTWNWGVVNISSSPIMNNVTAIGSGGFSDTTTNGGIYNVNSSVPVMTHVTAIGTGGAACMGVLNNSSSPIMNDVIASALDGTSWNHGLRNDSQSSPIAIHVTATGLGGAQNRGVQNGTDAMPFIQDSIIEGSTTGLYIRNPGTRVVNSKIIGGVDDSYPETKQCRGNYDENLADVDC